MLKPGDLLIILGYDLKLTSTNPSGDGKAPYLAFCLAHDDLNNIIVVTAREGTGEICTFRLV